MTHRSTERRIIHIEQRLARRRPKPLLTCACDVSPLTDIEREELRRITAKAHEANTMTVLSDDELERADELLHKCEGRGVRASRPAQAWGPVLDVLGRLGRSDGLQRQIRAEVASAEGRETVVVDVFGDAAETLRVAIAMVDQGQPPSFHVVSLPSGSTMASVGGPIP